MFNCQFSMDQIRYITLRACCNKLNSAQHEACSLHHSARMLQHHNDEKPAKKPEGLLSSRKGQDSWRPARGFPFIVKREPPADYLKAARGGLKFRRSGRMDGIMAAATEFKAARGP